LKTTGFLLCVLCVLCGKSASPQPRSTIFGFTARGAAVERSIERRFLLLPSPDKARDAHVFLTADPHVAGSPRDRVLAEWVRDRWREYGLERVEIVRHDVLLPYATDVRVDMPVRQARGGAPAVWHASLKEDPIPGDPSTSRDIGLPYHAYSASGDVTAPVVYAGSGNPADYEWLAAHGINITGKIALVRYSVPYSYRGFKALTAQRLGAAGILIYSDPADDGAGKGKTYPDGPWGPESHIQRGGIVYDFNVPGDPLTPGWASLPGAKRISAAEATSLPKIMSVPLSAKDARVILRALGGPDAPKAWQGGLPFTYRVGGSTDLHMRVKMDDGVRPIWTVTGQITGTDHPDDLVIVGNHRDAWVYGGVDPASGTASLMELARALGSMAKQGTRPQRTIVFANWDAEEFTLTSSTEWGEQHERELTAHAVAYLNVDSSASGTAFGASAVPSLNRLVTEAAEAVIDPETGKSIADATRTGAPRQGGALPGASGPDLVNNRLGSGSDYTVFLNFLGVPIVDMSFTGPYGVYHSVYDDHLWVQKFGDPGFRYHAAMARLWGVMALRLANAEVVPIDYRAYASRVREFVGELSASRPTAERAALAPLTDAVDRFAKAADAMSARVDALLASNRPSSTTSDPRPTPNAINTALMAAERALLSPDGIPGRPWYRHLIYAPKPTYAPEPLPGVSEALESSDPDRIADQVARLVTALDRAATVLTR
jgi:N-acetylated-alpha-linked acidic dipeptidase